jgi:dolichyl-phosphate beta-glucosyltransferase
MIRNSNKIPITIVIPAYNEELRLPPTLDEILAWKERSLFDVKILIVDDGSTDSTTQVVQNYANRHPEITLIRENHVGYMNAIMSGLTKAQTDLRVTIEADLPVHPDMLDKLAPVISNYDFVIGNRLSSESSLEGKSYLRKVISSFYSIFFRILFRVKCQDPQIGFKIYRARALEHVLPLLRLADDGLKSSEFVIKTFGLGYSVLEIPVDYKHDPDSRLVPKGKALAKVIESSLALLSLWVQTHEENRQKMFSVTPVRGRLLFFFLGPILNLRKKNLILEKK